MARRKSNQAPEKPAGKVRADLALLARFMTNRAVEVERRNDGMMVASVPLKRPWWLVPPLSWVIPFSSHRRVEMDQLGGSVLDLCDGRNTVEEIIESFAAAHKLSFREAQLPVTQFLRQLTERGIVAVVGIDKDTSES